MNERPVVADEALGETTSREVDPSLPPASDSTSTVYGTKCRKTQSADQCRAG